MGLSRHRGHQREQDPEQQIPKAKAGTPSSVALQYGNLMAQGDRLFQQRGAGLRFAAVERHRSLCRHRHKNKLSPAVRSRQPIRADQVLRNHRLICLEAWVITRNALRERPLKCEGARPLLYAAERCLKAATRERLICQQIRGISRESRPISERLKCPKRRRILLVLKLAYCVANKNARAG